mmetsp:Transcript_120588/g.375470  ORF Transcript_120588/g.375470 Transcript_120588/m.375470 type:complete len:272 (+) Transcript_120588:322-1137(+)
MRERVEEGDLQRGSPGPEPGAYHRVRLPGQTAATGEQAVSQLLPVRADHGGARPEAPAVHAHLPWRSLARQADAGDAPRQRWRGARRDQHSGARRRPPRGRRAPEAALWPRRARHRHDGAARRRSTSRFSWVSTTAGTCCCSAARPRRTSCTSRWQRRSPVAVCSCCARCSSRWASCARHPSCPTWYQRSAGQHAALPRQFVARARGCGEDPGRPHRGVQQGERLRHGALGLLRARRQPRRLASVATRHQRPGQAPAVRGGAALPAGRRGR